MQQQGIPAPPPGFVLNARSPVSAPVASPHVTSNFGPRTAPKPGASTNHPGTDYRGAVGDPAMAASDGEVIFAGTRNGYGNRVEVRHDDGTVSSYSHLSAMGVQPGARVTRGQQIGAIGATGNVTGPHLHFEINDGTGYVDPAGLIGQGVPDAEIAPPPPGFEIEGGPIADTAPPPAQAGAPGTQGNPIDLSRPLMADEVPLLVKGAFVRNGSEIYALPGDAFQARPQPGDEATGSDAYIRRPNLQDTIGNFAMGAAEQIPGLDEASTAVSAALKGIDYSTERDNYRLNQELGNQTNRTARVAGGLSGFAASMLAPGMGGVGFVRNGVGLADKTVRAGMVGGATSAVMGFGAEDGNLSERAQRAINDGLWGFGGSAVLGGLAPAAVPRLASGLSEAGAVVSRGFGRAPRDAEITPRATNAAMDYVERLVRSSGNDLEGNDVAARGGQITAAEAIGPSGVSNMAALTRRAGRAGTLAQAQIGARALEQPKRVVQDFADLTGMDPAGSADMIQNLADAGRRRAAPLYDAAYALPVRVTDDLQGILETPAGKKALANAVQIARNDRVDPTTLGFDFNEAGDVIHIARPTVQTLDYVKRGLDDVLEASRDGTTRRLNLTNETRPIVGLVTDLRADLIRQTGGEGGAYAQALAAGGEPIRLEQAFQQAGRLFLTGTPQRTFNTAIARMGEAERNALVAGFADKLFRDAEAGRLGTRQLNQVNVPVTREKLATLLGPERANDFMQRITDKIELSRSGGRMAPGTNSVSAEALEAMRDQDNGVGMFNDLARDIAQDPLTAIPRSAARAVSAPLAGFVRGMASPAPMPVRDEIARLLLLPPDDLAAILAQRGSATPNAGALARVLDGDPALAGAASSRPGARNARPETRRAQR